MTRKEKIFQYVVIFLLGLLAIEGFYILSVHAQVIDPVASDTLPIINPVVSYDPVAVPIAVFDPVQADPKTLMNADLRDVVTILKQKVADDGILLSKYAALYDSCKR